MCSCFVGSKGPTIDQLLSFLKSKSNDQLSSFSSELVSVVFVDGSVAGGPRLSFANGVWLDKSLPIKPSFKQIVDNVYKASSNLVDFQTKNVIFLLNKLKCVNSRSLGYFKISFGLTASELLKRLGLNLPFSGEGDLTEMVYFSQCDL